MNKKATLILVILAALSSATFADSIGKALISFRISNDSEFQRGNEIVEINFQLVKEAIQGKNFIVVYGTGNTQLAYQLEYKGMESVQNLLVMLPDLPAGKSIVLNIVEGVPLKPKARTFARYVPERKDDFAWENDRVAFRMYGKALEKEKDNAFGTDIWSKRTRELVIDDWYQGNDYHADHGQGMDFYAVGLTLGAGDIAPWHGDSIWYSKNWKTYKVLDNGPLRSSFQLGYDAWKVGVNEVTASKTISLDAGSHLNKVSVAYTIKGADQLNIVTGITKRKSPGSLLLDEKNGIIGYWEPEIPEKGIMGIGVIYPESTQLSIQRDHLLNHGMISSSKPLVYYNGGAWDREGTISSADAWFNYLSDFRKKLTKPLQVTLN